MVICGYGHDQTGQGDPYLPWRELLAMLTGDIETGHAPDQRPEWQTQRLQAAMPVTLPLLVAHAPDLIQSFLPGQALHERAAAIAPPEADWFQQLSRLVDSGAGPKLAEKDIFGQVTALLNAIAAQQPLLIILEDLHWADPASCGLLFHLSRHLGDSPMLLAGSYRPAEIVRPQGNRRHPLAGLVDEFKRQHGDIWLDLAQVSEAEGRQFVNDYLDTQPNRLDEPFRAQLYRQTRGHPLFTVELLRAMQERGELTQDEAGFWAATDAIDWQQLPARTEGVIESRIHRLEQALQTTLTIASVEGERFTAEVVARVQGVAKHTVVQQLSRALDKQQRLVTAQGLERLESGGQRLSRYRFRHNLFQRYFYQNLDELERTYLHEAVANTLESLYGDQAGQIAVPLAYHFQQAGVTDKAVGCLLQAGQQATQLGAYAEATAHLNQGLQLLQTLPDSPRRKQQELMLRLVLGHTLMALHTPSAPVVKEMFDRTRDLYLQVGETPQLLSALFGLTGFYMLRAELLTAYDLGQQFVRQARAQPDSAALLAALRMQGSILLFMGQLEPARAYLEESIALYNPNQPQTVATGFGQSSAAKATVYLAFTLWLLGYPDQAWQRVEEALRLVEFENDPNIQAHVLTFIAIISDFRRDLPTAQRYAEMAVKIANQHDLALWRSMGAIIQIATGAKQGQVSVDTAGQIQQILTAFRGTETGIGVPYALSLLAEVLIILKQPEMAQSLLAKGLAVVEQTEHRTWEPELHRLRGELLAQQGASPAEAERCYQQAIDLARRQAARSLELRAVLSLCRLWQAQRAPQKTKAARQQLTELYHWFSEGLDTHDLIEARAMLTPPRLP